MAQDFPARRHCRHAFPHCCGSLCLIGCDDHSYVLTYDHNPIDAGMKGLQVHETQKNARCTGINFLAY